MYTMATDRSVLVVLSSLTDLRHDHNNHTTHPYHSVQNFISLTDGTHDDGGGDRLDLFIALEGMLGPDEHHGDIGVITCGPGQVGRHQLSYCHPFFVCGVAGCGGEGMIPKQLVGRCDLTEREGGGGYHMYVYMG